MDVESVCERVTRVFLFVLIKYVGGLFFIIF